MLTKHSGEQLQNPIDKKQKMRDMDELKNCTIELV
jgi:hypothetical protein